jgi:hypothetical protein
MADLEVPGPQLMLSSGNYNASMNLKKNKSKTNKLNG